VTYDEAVRYLLALGGELAAPRQPAPASAEPVASPVGAGAGPRVAKFDLRNITVLAERLGSPHRACPSAHIAGTNGKGSTAAMLASILQQAGLKTGLYTSPHLERINERIRINGGEIADSDFAATFTRVHHLIEELLASGDLAAHPTFFECLTAMAFEYFAHVPHLPQASPPQNCRPEPRPGRGEGSAFSARNAKATADSSSRFASGEPALGMTTAERGTDGVDFAVFEVGLGGRLDSTNIVQPAVCIITEIEFDHENFLGHSIERIAGEKAGIIKSGVPVVCSATRPEARAVIKRRACELNAPFTQIDEAYTFEAVGMGLRVRPRSDRGEARPAAPLWTLELTSLLPGRFQARNAVAAIGAAHVLAENGFRITQESIQRGIAATRWPGRLERVQQRPDVYFDGTHNPAGARELVTFWEEHFAGRRIHLVFGAVRDKAVDEIAGLLFPRAACVYLTAPRTGRAISPQALAHLTAHHACAHQIVPDPEAALQRALEAAGPEDVVFAAGSLYLVGDLRRWWRGRSSGPSTAPTSS
jgi:dihydrofolate synthase/folylpolyglutamate synthase